MKNKHYIVTLKAWYKDEARRTLDKNIQDEIYLCTEEPFGEIAIRWYEEGARLECYEDSIEALVELSDVLLALAEVRRNKQEFSPEQFCSLLERCGFVDKTPCKEERQQIVIESPRYTVQKEPLGGWNIIDITGKDQPYRIDALQNRRPDELRRLTKESIAKSEEYSREVAEGWAYTWNIVELGYCGSCKRHISTVSDGKGHVAVGFHKLDKRVCFDCACAQEA